MHLPAIVHAVAVGVGFVGIGLAQLRLPFAIVIRVFLPITQRVAIAVAGKWVGGAGGIQIAHKGRQGARRVLERNLWSRQAAFQAIAQAIAIGIEQHGTSAAAYGPRRSVFADALFQPVQHTIVVGIGIGWLGNQVVIERKDLLPIRNTIAIAIGVAGLGLGHIQLVAGRQPIAIGVFARVVARQLRIRIFCNFNRIKHAAAVRIGQERRCPVLFDLHTIGQRVPIRVDQQGIRFVIEYFLAIAQTIAVGIGLQRVRFRGQDFLTVFQSIAIRVGLGRIGLVFLDFFAIF